MSLVAHTSFASDGKSAADKLSIKDFFYGSNYSSFALSASGNLVTYTKRFPRQYGIYVKDISSGKEYEVLRADKYSIERFKHENYIQTIKHDNEVVDLTWLGANVIALKEHSRGGFRRYVLITLDIDDDDISISKVAFLNQNGYWLDPKVDDDSYAIFAKYRENEENDSGYHVDLFNIKIKSKSLDSQTGNRKRLNKRGPKLERWLVDEKGQRTAGVRYVDKKPELFIRQGTKSKPNRLKHVWTGDVDDHFLPVLYDEKNSALYILTNHKTDKKSLQIFDLSSHEIRETVYIHPKYDLRDVIISRGSVSILGVEYLEKGAVSQYYFDSRLVEHKEALSKASGAENTYSLGTAYDNANRLFSVSGSDSGGEIFVYREEEKDYVSVIDLKPWLKNASLQKSKVITLTANDNSEIEAFLTMPEEISNPPLLVIPHGGPIGVSDTRYYSPEIQVLVDAGYATLQVNYRGSSGYGKKFKQDGMGQWGQLIEDDIELALKHVKNNFTIANDKVCIIGGSYGGYSALYSVIRSPELYQCAASFAGVTDLALLFQRSDIENDDNVQSQLRKIVGNPETEQDKLFKYSPIYHASKITKPVFIAHGTEDEVVDIEHGYRLRFALQANKIKHEWSVLDGFGHSFETVDQAEHYYSKLIGFLDKHLKK